MREPVCYLLNYPRPIGLEPTIYLTKPYTEPLDEDGWAPELIECYTFSDALSRIMHFNIELALKEFKVQK